MASGPPAPDTLRPAFDNTLQAIGFLALLSAALLSPILIAHLYHGDRQHIYRVMRYDAGNFSGAQREIFEVKGDIDILFVGNSTLWAGISSPMVEESLSRKLGRQAHVVTFGCNYGSMDVPYMEVREVLEHKRIHMVVSTFPIVSSDAPSSVAARFISYGDPPETTAGLPFRYRPILYADYVLRSPRDAMDYLRPFRSPPPWCCAPNNGSLMMERGWQRSPFSPFSPRPPELRPDDLIYSARNPDNFEYRGPPAPPYQVFYLRMLYGLTKERHVKFALANPPRYIERRHTRLPELQYWPAVLGPRVAMVGIPPAVLFHDLTDEQIRKLYYNNDHFNLNGCTFYTRALIPTLLELYTRDSNI